MKKPIIPSVSSLKDEKISLTETDLDEIPKTYMSNDEKKYESLYKLSQK